MEWKFVLSDSVAIFENRTASNIRFCLIILWNFINEKVFNDLFWFFLDATGLVDIIYDIYVKNKAIGIICFLL